MDNRISKDKPPYLSSMNVGLSCTWASIHSMKIEAGLPSPSPNTPLGVRVCMYVNISTIIYARMIETNIHMWTYFCTSDSIQMHLSMTESVHIHTQQPNSYLRCILPVEQKKNIVNREFIYGEQDDYIVPRRSL